MIVTIAYEIVNGYVTVVLEISYGGYSGQFFFDHNLRYLGAIEILNPPWNEINRLQAAFAAITSNKNRPPLGIL